MFHEILPLVGKRADKIQDVACVPAVFIIVFTWDIR